MVRDGGPVAVVTGGASGIGLACALALAGDGHRVVVADIDEQAARSAAERMAAAAAIAVDVGEEPSVVRLVEAVEADLGRIDVLVNSAARTDPAHHDRDGDVVTMDLGVWRATFATDLDGAMLMCKHVVPVMVRGGGGSVVNISSLSADGGDLVRAAYSAAKAGVNSLTRSVAVQYGRDGVRANAVSPGGIVGPSFERNLAPEIRARIVGQTLLGYPGRPEDVAHLVAFLVSEKARYITGQVIAVDGGTRSQLHHVPSSR